MTMKKKALRKEFYMEVRKTLNRFLSLLLITALGVAFFSGIRATQPDMELSADTYYDEARLMDISVQGTLGLTEEDAQSIAAIEGVEEVMPYYSMDMFGTLEDERLNLQVMSVPETMNLMTVTEGRMPEAENECVVDNQMLADGVCQLGDTITLSSATDTETEDILSVTEFTVVGAVTSPYYLSLERGTTSIGNGTLNGFLAVQEDAFSLDYYTQICVRMTGADKLGCYGDPYSELADTVVDRIEAIADERCEIRYAEVQEEGRQEIADAEAEIADAEAELADAAQELEDGRADLEEAKQELADGKAELADGEAEFAEKEQDYLDARQQTSDGWIQADEGRKQIINAERQLEGGWEQYEEGKKQIEEGYAALAPYEEQYAQLEEAEAQLQSGIGQAQAGIEEVQKLLSQIEEIEKLPEDEWQPGWAELVAQKAALEEKLSQGQAALAELENQLAACQEGMAQLAPVIEETRAQLDAGAEELAASKKQLDAAQAEIDAANSKISESVEQLSEAEDELADAEQQLADGRAELADARQEIADGEQEIADAEEELADGEREYADAKAEADVEIADAREQIADAEEELADMELPEWYVLDRDYIASYVDYGQNAERIGAIGRVFPVLFFLVAALVCLTTMTRMVEEERTQIGTLKALGYSRGNIAAKYILYALLSSLLGSLLGLVAGQKFLPWVIIEAYKILYPDLPYTLTPLNLQYSVMATAAAVLCTTLAAWAACYKELFEVPAELMRPAAPKAGKRVFLERITFIWKRLNFSRKASVRNLIRYKKRFFMTIFGIGGCTALLLLGFGLKDSVSYLGVGQFENIFVYDASISIDTEAEEEKKAELMDTVASDDRVTDGTEMLETAVDVEKDGVQKSAYLIVPQDESVLAQYIRLQNRETGESYELTDDGIVISEKLAALLNVSEGDTVTLGGDDTEHVEAVVTHITENYFMHYVYMDRELYEELYDKEPEWNMLFVNLAQTDEAFENQVQEDYMELDAVLGVTFISGTAETVEDMLDTMNVVILVLVVSAGMLAFIVLYNLNNINISERKRELATLKVLGFFDREVSSYVNRENIMLTVIGTAVGLIMGTALHRYVMTTVETDTLMFGRTIELHSFVYSILLTLVFSIIVNGMQYFKLRKIDMVESLKSVE
ncbi:hypothetical protein B5E77_01470 [Lachnoclostridium sp. An131]|uniref:FtsX-like permease family protein n=1 Tax=Lachnoclostridium sp. An131 TaxID=1965555 RepID=UPI000B5578B6|nr:FtsX-like permease family protein [Lachnoclostridium sp. An131]OUQ29057.1 hypothetical protein B5E77_01470 [Lachnoclostridium sp. An131]